MLKKALISAAALVLVLLTLNSASAVVLDLGSDIDAVKFSNSGYDYLDVEDNEYVTVVRNTTSGRYSIWSITVDLPSWTATRLVTNMTENPEVTVGANGQLFIGMSDGIYVRKSTSTNPHDWTQLKNSDTLSDYYLKITTDSPEVLTADSEYVYYVYDSGGWEIKAIDSSFNVFSLGTFSVEGGVACNTFSCNGETYTMCSGADSVDSLLVIDNKWFYVVVNAHRHDYCGYSTYDDYKCGVVAYKYNGSFHQFDKKVGGTKVSGGSLTLTNQVIYASGSSDFVYSFEHDNYVANFSESTAFSYTPRDDTNHVQSIDGDLLVYIDQNNDFQTKSAVGNNPPFKERDDRTDQPDQNISSDYSTELSRSTMYAGGTVKVYITDSEGNYVENVPIYVDGNNTGKKTQYHGFDWIPLLGGLIGEGKPYAEISVDETGSHYVNGEVGSVMSEGIDVGG